MTKDSIKKQMIEDAKRQIDKRFEGETLHLTTPRIFNDASGLAGWRTEGCDCCTADVFDSQTQDNIVQYFTVKDQKELVNHFMERLVKHYNYFRPMDRGMSKHLNGVIDYLWKDEQKHHLELAEEDRDGHVFNHLIALKEWTLGK